MTGRIWTHFYLLSLILLTNAEFQCKSTEKCECIATIHNYNYQCPSIHFHVIPDRLLEVNCLKDQINLEDQILNMKIGKIETATFGGCALNKNFTQILKQIGVTKVKKFILQYSNGISNFTDYEIFHDVTGTEILELTNNNIKFIDENIFNSFNNLIELNLRSNNVHLTNGLFKNLNRLKVLDLALNKLSDLPIGLFQELPELEMLHLWGNKLSTLNATIVESLVNLQVLELSRNLLTEIPSDSFKKLKKLKHLSLSANNLQNLSSDLFSENINLEVVKFNFNPSLTELPELLFGNLKNLRSVAVDNCKLRNLPGNLFRNSINLETITLHGNELKFLPEDLFRGLVNLASLNLGYNRLSVLPNTIFSSLVNLEALNLEYNFLTEITDPLFYNLGHLEKLNMKNNELSVLSSNTFERMTDLKEVFMANNNLRFTNNDLSPFVNNLFLEKLDLSNNRIDTICTDFLINKVELKELNLSYNNITYVSFSDLFFISLQVSLNLSNNKISTIDFKNFEQILELQKETIHYAVSNTEYTVINFNDNPLKCDCRIADFARYFEESAKTALMTHLIMRTNNLLCSSPNNLVGRSVSQLKWNTLNCPIDLIDAELICPDKCHCKLFVNRTIIFDCSNKGLTEIPKINSALDRNVYEAFEIDLRGNFLKTAPLEGMGYENVTKIDLSNNEINKITWIPTNLQVLELKNNSLSELPINIISSFNLTNLQKLSLGYNPWSCDCSVTDLVQFLITGLQDVQIDINDIRCNEDEKPLIFVNKANLCSGSYISWTIIILSTTATVLFFVAIVTTITIRKSRSKPNSLP